MTEPGAEGIEAPAGADAYFECTYCHAAYGDWVEACPACDQLVVRVVAR